MRLYGITLERGLLLAPLSGYTNWPMRILSRRFGAELCYTEMISAEGLVRNTKNTLCLLKRPPQDAPLIAQIFAHSSSDAALAAKIIEDAGFDGIDINMGCPVKKVVNRGAGAALMRDVPLAQHLTQAVAAAVSIPVSVKMRAGWDSASINARELAGAVEMAGVRCIILHPRTRMEMYKGIPRWELLSDLRRSTAVSVVASGDIRIGSDIERLRALGADGFMVGRAAVGRPWIFRELAGGKRPDIDERREIMLEHLDMLCSLYGRQKGTVFMRKFISGYVRGIDGASRFRSLACKAVSFQELQAIIKRLPASRDSGM